MIGLLIAAAAAVQSPAVATPAPPSYDSAAAVDPARLAAATQLLAAMHIERQYDALISQMLPVMTKQIFGSLQNDSRLPARIRSRLSDPEVLKTMEKTFSTKLMAQFRSRYATLISLTAQEYARAFELSELNAVQAFYASPAGQRALTLIPLLQQKLVPLGMKIGSDAGAAAMKETVETLGLDDQENKS
ncbi:MAG: DUF2059 domain-containing protein [Sphingomonas phyllosphaerae]|uniref:DUF2059 domain-containing protein n=1 Tax=Sphingomonas phyllosphaerae TaxID=257003 RepID=UPI002FF99F4C